ncbi:MAG: ThuA domain-containing protein [Armatimonadetes bacterium]|nr:ThuA domain-containing protein [Armatimonadota bacterium]
MSRRMFGGLALLAAALLVSSASRAAEPLRVLFISGQNNHDWKSAEPWITWALESCGRFRVTLTDTPPAPNAGDPAYDERWKGWRPKFTDYDVVVSNYNGERWPDEVKAAFVDYIKNGGGLVVMHAADNSFPEWPEYNQMIGVGGWGGRNEKSGPMLYWQDGKVVRDETPGAGGTHGNQYPFLVETREPQHPILEGLPTTWRHMADELYCKLRGPAENLTVLATSYNEPDQRGTGKNEPILMVINFGKGRIFHTVMGHDQKAWSGLGFQVTLQRGTEWAATGAVTLPAPRADELTADKPATRMMPGK